MRRVAPERPHPKRYDLQLVPLLVIPALLAVLGFVLGAFSEHRKQVFAEDSIAVDNRVKIFTSATGNFAMYMVHWSRLRAISANPSSKAMPQTIQAPRVRQTATTIVPEDDFSQSNKRLDERKESYRMKRDDARDHLFADLERARLFFGSDVIRLIDEFEAYDSAQSIKTLEALPNQEDWRKRGRDVFEKMKEEIGRDQSKQAHWYYGWF